MLRKEERSGGKGQKGTGCEGTGKKRKREGRNGDERKLEELYRCTTKPEKSARE